MDAVWKLSRCISLRKSPFLLAGVGGASAVMVARRFLASSNQLPPEGKAVLVTGCDTKAGFGHAAVRRLHDLGYVVFSGCLDVQAARANLYSDLAKSPKFQVVQLDVVKQESIDAAVGEVGKWLNANPNYKLFAVVNNAGIGGGGFLEWQTMEAFQQIFEVNTFGVARVTKSFLPLIRNSGAGSRVVVIASLASEMPNPSLMAYCASKAATLSIADVLRFEMSRFKIQVSTILPDFYRTNIVTNSRNLEEDLAKVKPELIEAYGGQERVKRVKKGIQETLPNLAKTDITPVVNCIVDAVTSPVAQHRYYPIEFRSKLALFSHKYKNAPKWRSSL